MNIRKIYDILYNSIDRVVKISMTALVNNILDKLDHTRTMAGFNNLGQGISASKFNIELIKGK